MRFFKRPHLIRRYLEPTEQDGWVSIPYEDMTLLLDVQTMSDAAVTTPDGTKSVQRLKVFCDSEILTENRHTQQKADRLWFQGKWFDCQSSRLSENTPLRHWTATFVECLDFEDPPSDETSGTESGHEDTPGGQDGGDGDEPW